jgi:parallel beta-helix repeat protein
MTPLRNPLLVMKLLGLFLALALPVTLFAQDRAVLSSHAVQKGSGVESPDGLQNPSPAPPKAYQRPSSVQATPIAQVQQADFGGASTFSVTNTNDSGSGSLRQAIRDANASSGADIINFSIPGSGVHTITPDSALPALTGPVLIDGTTQAGYADHPLIEIDGSQAGTGVNGLVLRGGSSTIRGLAVNRFVNSGIYDGHGIVLETLGGNTLEGNYIGTDPTGLSARPNGGSGVVIAGSSSRNKIGAPTAAGRNIFSGNSGDGLQISRGSGGRNLVQGNIIGADVTGVSVLPNGGNGIFVGAQYDTIGGTAYGNGNLVSGNMLPGIYLGSSARWTVVQGNHIGTTLPGDAALGNANNGIMVDSAASTTIQSNVISGNLSTGLYIYGTPATGNAILDNFIGTNQSGTAPLGNSSNGVVIDDAPANTIGSPAHTNLISGNEGVGVWISGAHASGNIVRSNLIGTNLSGTDSIPNKGRGIFIENAPGNTIGGVSLAHRNAVSGNRGSGIYIKGSGATGNTVLGNFVGANQSGIGAVANKACGIVIEDAPGNTIGGTGAEEGNVISGNATTGILIVGLSASRNTVLGNYIGTAAGGNSALGNGGNGIVINNAPDNTIGGSAQGARNVISGNAFPGLGILNEGASGNKILGNLIGLAASGTSPLPNATGVVIDNAPRNVIGGSTLLEQNVISGNTLYGIKIRNQKATGNKVTGNLIGPDYVGYGRSGGNGGDGVVIEASQDTIFRNTISYNGGAGIFDSSGTGNVFQENSISQNGGLGIDLAPRGFTKNEVHPGLDEPNNHLFFPLLDWAEAATNGDALVHVRLTSTPLAVISLEFYGNAAYDPSHFGEGATFLTRSQVATDNAGNWEGTITIPGPVDVQEKPYLSATATDPAGNTSEFSQVLCLLDTDGDGLNDLWETEGWGIDADADSVVDLSLYDLGATREHKDIFVEVDAMVGLAPDPTAINSVTQAFLDAPKNLVKDDNGIELHISLDDKNIPRVNWQDDAWTYFRAAKDEYFARENGVKISPARLKAKEFAFRYCIFAEQCDAEQSSGWSHAPLPSNEFMVTLGYAGGGTPEQQAGVFMHELGHCLGLLHGGRDTILFKPNYISVMNYTWMIPSPYQPVGTWALRYSTSTLNPLYEDHLNEIVGVGPASNPPGIVPIPFRDGTGSLHWGKLAMNTGIDWNGNDDSIGIAEADVDVDINNLDPQYPTARGEALQGFEDWSNLRYSFRGILPSPAPGLPPAQQAPDFPKRVFDLIRSLPPPKPLGRFAMDGLLDSSAILLASHQGMSLYAAVRRGQLYVATNTAQSQGGDVFLIVAIPPGALRQSPLLKGGKVAAWSAFLMNRSADNARGWYDASGAPLTYITVDTVGTVLEGVIDFEFLTGVSPDSVYLAVGKYDSASGGALLQQVPAGNGDANIDAAEFLSVNPPPAGARWRQQGEKIVPCPGGQVQGFVALSSDGNTALIGGRTSQADLRGEAWVYKRVEGQWVQEGTTLVSNEPEASSGQQMYVALSADGNTAIVGGPWDNGGTGAARIYTQAGGIWTQQGNKLVGSGAVGNALQGLRVAISADGNTAVILGPYDNGTVGAAWVFVRANGVWSQQGGKLVAPGAAGRAGLSSVAISGDGNTLIVGNPYDSIEKGAVWIYTRSGNVWTPQASKLIGTGAVGAWVWQGCSVALSYDGNTALVGGPFDDGGVGATWVFGRTNGTWQQVGGKLVGFDHSYGVGSQGYSVAISSDGNTAIIGGPDDSVGDYSGCGAVWVFRRTFGVWNQYGKKLAGRNNHTIENATFCGQGSALAISGDGSTALIGSVGDSLYQGAVWAFVSSDTAAFRITSVSGTNLGGNAVQIDWRTFSETNRCTFTIQRKAIQDADFADIPNSSVLGRGAPDISQVYAFTDSTVRPGTWIYRVKGVDLGGLFVYSDTVKIDVVTGIGESGRPGEFELLQNYPNPWNPSTVIRYTVARRAHVSIAVYNTLGQRVTQIVDAEQEPGFYSVLFRAGGLASGVYFYQMRSAGFVMTRKFLLLR